MPKRNSENSQTEILQTSFHEDEKQSKVQDNPVDWSSQQVFILVKDRCVIGAVLAEAVTRAFRRIVPTEEMTDNLDELNVSGIKKESNVFLQTLVKSAHLAFELCMFLAKQCLLFRLYAFG